MPESFPGSLASLRTRLWAAAAAAGLLFLYLLAAPPSIYPPSFPHTFPKHELISHPAPAVHYPDRVGLQTTLLSRLRSVLSRPIPSYADSLIEQQANCPNSAAQASEDQVRDDSSWWKTVPTAELEAARADVVWSLASTMGLTVPGSLEEQKVNPGSWNSLFGDGRRGIVYAGGSPDTAKRIINSLSIVRKLKCTLPVEIWAYSWELPTLEPFRSQLEALGDVTFRTSRTPAPPGGGKLFQIKGEAIAWSSFSEVLYLDSDNVPARDPTFLFDSDIFAEHGMVLWPDFARDGPENPIWRITGKPCDPNVWSAETGQVLANKMAQNGMVLAALLVAEKMQLERKFWFRLSQGDKDTFRYAFYLLDSPYTPAPHYVASAGSSTLFKGHSHCGHTMLQFGLSSSEWDLPEVKALVDPKFAPPIDHAPPLFVHANLLKYSGGLDWWWMRNFYSYRRGNTFETIKLVTPDFSQERDTSALQDIRYYVYHHRGLCTDLSDSAASDGEASSRVKTVPWGDAWGGMLRGFENTFFDNGGLTAV